MSTQKSVQRESGSVEASTALRLEQEKVEQIVDALNTDLAATYVLYHQVKKHHWNVEGAEFRDIHLFLGEAAEELEETADELAERVQASRSRVAQSSKSMRLSSPRITTFTTSVRRSPTTWMPTEISSRWPANTSS